MICVFLFDVFLFIDLYQGKCGRKNTSRSRCQSFKKCPAQIQVSKQISHYFLSFRSCLHVNVYVHISMNMHLSVLHASVSCTGLILKLLSFFLNTSKGHYVLLSFIYMYASFHGVSITLKSITKKKKKNSSERTLYRGPLWRKATSHES